MGAAASLVREDATIAGLDALSRELACVIELIEQLETVQRPHLLALYQEHLGELERRLLQLQVEARATQWRIEELQGRRSPIAGRGDVEIHLG